MPPLQIEALELLNMGGAGLSSRSGVVEVLMPAVNILMCGYFLANCAYAAADTLKLLANGISIFDCPPQTAK
jgi:hypothetical protein